MTTIINLFAGPGVGKSTIAAKTFALMKERGLNAELVTEYVKTWAWEKRTPVATDQFYLFGKQTRREALLVGRVDFVVTDSPSLIAAYYTQLFGEPSTAVLFRAMALEYRRMLEAQGHRFADVWLTRRKAYDARGRFQTEAEARTIDAELLSFLQSMRVPLVEVDGDPTAAPTIMVRVVGE